MKVNICYGTNSYPVNVMANSSPIQELEKFTRLDSHSLPPFVVFLGSLYASLQLGTKAVMASTSSDAIRQGFSQIVDVFSAIAEPILWGYAVIGLVMVATGSSRQQGWDKVKKVAYAYIGIQALPAFFAFLRYLAKLLTQALQFAQ